MESQKDHVEMFVKGSIVGHLVGDSLGYPYLSDNIVPDIIDLINGPGGELPGEYTSVGAFSIATMDSLLDYDYLDCDDLMAKFYEVYIAGHLTSNGNCYDVGQSTTHSIRNFSNGIPIDKCPIRTEESNDADAISRVLPIALFFIADTVPTIVSKAHDACKITHGHIRSQVACSVYCLIIRNIILQKSEKVFNTLETYYQESGMSEHLKQLVLLKNWKESGQIDSSIESCFWTAWSAFSKYENDYMFSVTEAVKNGVDKNATGSLAGSFASASNGLNNIPSKWLKGIRLTSEVMDIIIRFVDNVVEKITSLK
jgi:ADP-ribosylglycohydrolase